MSTELATLLVGVAFAAVSLVTIGVAVARRVNRVSRTLDEIRASSLARIAGDLTGPVAAVPVCVEAVGRIDSPLARLTFKESLDPTLFAEASRASAQPVFAELPIADGAAVVVQSVRLTQQGTEMIVSVSAKGQKLIDEARALIPVHGASRSRLPLLTDARTGRVIEQLKELPASKVTARIASASTALIGAAHLIAGADVAKRLAHVESKVDKLIALRRTDQLAKLERVYVLARELASSEMDSDARREMWRLRGELRELRSAWRQEFHLKLGSIGDPANAGFFQRVFTRQKSIDRRVVGGISDGEAEVALIEYSMRLEHVLAIGSGTMEAFRDSQQGELDELQKLHDLLQEKAKYISGKYPELAVDRVVDALGELVSVYRVSLPCASPVSDEPKIDHSA